MNSTVAFVFGMTVGFLAAALLILGTLTRYVSSDLDAFAKWLDKA